MTPELIQLVSTLGLGGAIAVYLIVRIVKTNRRMEETIERKDNQLLALVSEHDKKREDGQKERLDYERQANDRMVTIVSSNTHALEKMGQAVKHNTHAVTELRVHLNGGRR